MKAFIYPVAILVLICSRGFAQVTPAECDDTKQIYKVCSDQLALFNKAKGIATEQGKFILITFGFSSCPWCQSMFRILHSSDFVNSFSSDMLVLEIGTYNGSDKVLSGVQVLKDILTTAGTPLAVVKGYPFIVLLNPRNDQLVYLDTGDLEMNTATSKGHDHTKVVSTIQNSINILKEATKGK